MHCTPRQGRGRWLDGVTRRQEARLLPFGRIPRARRTAGRDCRDSRAVLDGQWSFCTPAGADFEIGRILHLKSEIRNLQLDWRSLQNSQAVQSDISDFGFEMQDSSNFEISSLD